MSRLSEAQFHHLVDQTQRQVEDAYDDSGLDLDLENAGGVLTVKFDNGSQVILSRQPPLVQLWVAARSGGYHFDWDGQHWVCDSSPETLGALLVRVTLEQTGESVALPGL